MKNNKKIYIVIFLIVLAILAFFLIKKAVAPSETGDKPEEKQIVADKIDQNKSVEAKEIIKCQKVIVSPKATIELFVYFSGRKIRADYRVNATTEEESSKSQIYYDGETLFFWQPALNFGGEKTVNPEGLKMMLPSFNINIDSSVLDQVIRFSANSYSGDYLCRIWDEGDYVFELPDDVIFNESKDAEANAREAVGQIYSNCSALSGEINREACEKNLGCF